MLINSPKIKDVKLEIGHLVKLYRKSEKISQQELADKLGLSRITIQNLESGKNFTIDTLLKVLQYFDKLNEYFEFIVNERTQLEEIKPLYDF